MLFNVNKKINKNVDNNNNLFFKLNTNKKSHESASVSVSANYINDYSIKEVYIFSTKYTINLANNLKKYFTELNINVNVFNYITNELIDECRNNNNLYFFIIGPQYIINWSQKKRQKSMQLNNSSLDILPKNKYILYQIEQLNQTNNPINQSLSQNLLANSYSIFDYSKINLQYHPREFKENIKLLQPLIDEPVFKVNQPNNSEELYIEDLYIKKFVNNIIYNVLKKYNYSIDILFIGTLNERRTKILNELKNYNSLNNLNYVIKIVSNVFGDKLTELIKKSKIVINLHYYPNAILEIFRIHDLLPYECKILSENPGNEEEMNLVEKYGNVVRFFPVINDDLTNIDNMYKLINDNLEAEIDLIERKNFIDNVNGENNNCLKLKLNMKTYNFITFSTMGEPYDKGLNLIDKSKTIEKIIHSNNNYINYYNYNTENIIKNYGIETKNKYISEHYDISYRCIHHYRGNTIGFWKWKPFVIFEELKKINYNDILIYYDCNIDKNPQYLDEIKNIKYFTNKILNDKNFGFLYENLNNKKLICKNYVKNDIFEKLGCTEEYFKNAPLKRANRLFIRKTKSTENLIYNWLKLTETSLFLPESNEEIMNSAHKNELYGWNTHDQAVLNILYLYYEKYNLL